MYEYTMTQNIKGKRKTLSVYSNQHYTQSGFNKLLKQVAKDFENDGISFVEKDKLLQIERELVNNHEFIGCTEMKIEADVTDL